MAQDLNRCEFIGRLGRDPETRYTAGGNPVTSFSIACGWKSKEGEGTTWIPIVAFGRLAEVCAEYLRKGSQVFAAGRYQTSTYEKDGEKRYSTNVVLVHLQMLGSRQDRPESNDGMQYGGKPPQGEPLPENFDDDIPF